MRAHTEFQLTNYISYCLQRPQQKLAITLMGHFDRAFVIINHLTIHIPDRLSEHVQTLHLISTSIPSPFTKITSLFNLRSPNHCFIIFSILFSFCQSTSFWTLYDFTDWGGFRDFHSSSTWFSYHGYHVSSADEPSPSWSFFVNNGLPKISPLHPPFSCLLMIALNEPPSLCCR